LLRHFALNHIDSQLENVKFQLTSTVLKWGELENHLRNLRETIEREVKQHHFYHYPLDKAKKIVSFEEDWGAVLARFNDVVTPQEGGESRMAQRRHFLRRIRCFPL
jgi:hypothetical protein